ncbi:MAG: cytochrome c oxidase subunit II [Caulobacter sp.]|nr:cytochrome c oxidase subunit II [Caulobacter sp.]
MIRRITRLAPCLALAGCAGVQSALDPASDQASSVFGIWSLMLWICGVMYALVLAFLAAAIWKARHRLSGPPIAEGQKSPADRPLTRVLTGWVGLTVVGLLVLTFGSFLVDRQLALADQKNAQTIKITANQWWWKVEYDDPVPGRRFVTANELHLPVDRPARIELEAGDVIHSFWVPNLGGKQDLIPGRTNRLLVTPRRVGLFRGQCAEFCGLQHAWMALDVTVEPQTAFAAWAEAQRRAPAPPSTPEALRGRDVFIGAACNSCHQVTGQPAQGQTGPDLTHMASRPSLAAGARPYSRQALDEWLRDPQALKPGNHMPLVATRADERAALVAYLDTLK